MIVINNVVGTENAEFVLGRDCTDNEDKYRVFIRESIFGILQGKDCIDIVDKLIDQSEVVKLI